MLTVTVTASESPHDLRREAVRGASAMLPLLIGYLPFALMIGLAARSSSDPLAAWAGALLIFGGSAQLSVIELVGHGSGVTTAVATALLVNVRLTVYSTSLVPLWRSAPLVQRLAAAAVVVDPTWMVARQREQHPGTAEERRAFYAGAAVVLALGWSATIGAGITLGTPQAATSFLGIATPLCLSTIVAPHLRTAAGLRCVCAAGSVAALTSAWPAGTGLLMAMAVGAAAGTFRRPGR